MAAMRAAPHAQTIRSRARVTLRKRGIAPR
jgi:hypothetical protein